MSKTKEVPVSSVIALVYVAAVALVMLGGAVLLWNTSILIASMMGVIALFSVLVFVAGMWSEYGAVNTEE